MINAHSAIIIDKTLESLLLPLSSEEYNLLRSNIQEEGCLSPLLFWNNKGKDILIDGHNRFKICNELGIEYRIDYLKFKNLDEARFWIINNQLGRRNLSPDQLSYYRGLQYLQLKKNKGGYENVLSKGQRDFSTSELIASKFHVSPSTIKRDANYAKGLEIVGASNKELKLKLLNGKTSFNKKDIQFIGESDIKFKIKNESDLYNKLDALKKESLNQVEKELKEIQIEEKEDPTSIENPFQSYEGQIKRIKGSILSYINKAIENKDLKAIVKLKELIEKLEFLISKE